jgi:hypothetical protein
LIVDLHFASEGIAAIYHVHCILSLLHQDVVSCFLNQLPDVCHTFTLMTRPITFSTFTGAVKSPFALAFENFLRVANFMATIAICLVCCVILQVVIQILEAATRTSSVKEFYKFTWTGR